MTGRGWPPPTTFDSVPLSGSAQSSEVELVSPIDPAYGIRTRRRIALDSDEPILTITTTYEKLEGKPVKVGVGVITQLRDPERAFLVPPEKKPRFPAGYVWLNFDLPQNVKKKNGLVSLTRSPANRSMIGSDASTLLWMDNKYVLRIDSPRVKDSEYPNYGSSAVIYTNPDPEAYVELETFGPLQTMNVGDRIERTNTYTLLRRTGGDPLGEAKNLLGRH
jgi:hypothetical protein